MASSNYGGILKATSFLGGASVINLFVGLARAKAGAVFLGPDGVGLVNIYFNLIHMMRTGFEMGIGGSGMKQLAEAKGKGHTQRFAELFAILLRLYLLLGVAAFLFGLLAAPWLSQATFGNQEHTADIRWLALNLPLMIFVPYFGGILAVHGAMGLLAKNNLFSVLWGVAFSIAFYWWLGLKGIVPAILATSVCSLIVAWYYGRKISIPPASFSLSNFFSTTKGLVPLGLALVWNDLLIWILNVYKSGFLARELGLDANGIYTAAWGLSALFVNMVLSALTTEFYPRLCVIAHNAQSVRRCLDEQIEVTLLLALPGLLGTILFSKVLILVVYSSAFLPAAELLLWFTLSNFFRIVTWPIPYALLARNHGFAFAAYNTSVQLLGLAILLFVVPRGGLVLAVAIGALTGIVTNAILYAIAWKFCGYVPSLKSFAILFGAGGACLGSILAVKFLPALHGHAIAALVFAIATLICFRVLLLRIHDHPRLVQVSHQIRAIAWAIQFMRKVFRI